MGWRETLHHVGIMVRSRIASSEGHHIGAVRCSACGRISGGPDAPFGARWRPAGLVALCAACSASRFTGYSGDRMMSSRQ